MDESFASLVSRLAVLRLERDQHKVAMDKVIEEAKKDKVYVAARLIFDTDQLQITALEEKVRDWAVEHYKNTGSKKPHPALQIRVTKAIVYATDKAMEWCEKNLPVAIKRTVDAKLFEKTVQSIGALPDFVIVTEEPKATIATDLTPYLPEETESPEWKLQDIPF